MDWNAMFGVGGISAAIAALSTAIVKIKRANSKSRDDAERVRIEGEAKRNEMALSVQQQVTSDYTLLFTEVRSHTARLELNINQLQQKVEKLECVVAEKEKQHEECVRQHEQCKDETEKQAVRIADLEGLLKKHNIT